MGLAVQECSSCGRRYFPARLRCAACDRGELRTVVVESGVLGEVTRVERIVGQDVAVDMGVVTVDGGPQVIVRLSSSCAPGERVALASDGGVPVARPHEALSA